MLQIFAFDPFILQLLLQELNEELFRPMAPPAEGDLLSIENPAGTAPTEPAEGGDATAVSNTIRDLHMELIFMYHRVCLKLAQLGPGKDLNVLD